MFVQVEHVCCGWPWCGGAVQSFLASSASQGQTHLHCCKDIQGQRTQKWVFFLPNSEYFSPWTSYLCVESKCFFCSLSVDIEDLDNWHGKPIPKDKVEDLLNDLQALIQVPNKTLCPELPKEDTAPADLSPISMPSPPAYKKGDKVHLKKNMRHLAKSRAYAQGDSLQDESNTAKMVNADNCWEKWKMCWVACWMCIICCVWDGNKACIWSSTG